MKRKLAYQRVDIKLSNYPRLRKKICIFVILNLKYRTRNV